VSDLHGSRAWFDWVAQYATAQNCAVAISGDLIDADAHHSPRDIKRQVSWISDWVRTACFPLFVCSGNHDMVVDENAAWLTNLARQGHVTVDGGIGAFSGRRVVCLPFGAGPEVFLKPQVMRADIWLHHEPPSDSGLGRSNRGGQVIDFGSDDLMAALAPAWNPGVRLVLSGHVHDAPRWSAVCGNTLCLNAAGANPRAARPKHILIDFATGTAQLRDGHQAVHGVRLN